MLENAKKKLQSEKDINEVKRLKKKTVLLQIRISLLKGDDSCCWEKAYQILKKVNYEEDEIKNLYDKICKKYYSYFWFNIEQQEPIGYLHEYEDYKFLKNYLQIQTCTNNINDKFWQHLIWNRCKEKSCSEFKKILSKNNSLFATHQQSLSSFCRQPKILKQICDFSFLTFNSQIKKVVQKLVILNYLNPISFSIKNFNDLNQTKKLISKEVGASIIIRTNIYFVLRDVFLLYPSRTKILDSYLLAPYSRSTNKNIINVSCYSKSKNISIQDKNNLNDLQLKSYLTNWNILLNNNNSYQVSTGVKIALKNIIKQKFFNYQITFSELKNKTPDFLRLFSCGWNNLFDHELVPLNSKNTVKWINELKTLNSQLPELVLLEKLKAHQIENPKFILSSLLCESHFSSYPNFPAFDKQGIEKNPKMPLTQRKEQKK